MERKMLVVVDMLNDFIHPDGALYFPEALNIIPSVKDCIDHNVKHKSTIVYLMDSHEENDKEFERFPKHCVKGYWGSEIIENLHPKYFGGIQDLFYVHKHRYSGFYKTILDEIVDVVEPTKVTVVGVCTSICVMDTVGEFANRDIQTIVPVNCVADFDNGMHDFSLERMVKIYGTNLV